MTTAKRTSAWRTIVRIGSPKSCEIVTMASCRNDWRYETIAAIFDAVADGSDNAGEIADSLTDIYNSALLAWLSDNLNRLSYVDDASADGLTQGNADVFSQIRTGQYLAIEQMAAQILAAVEENAEVDA